MLDFRIDNAELFDGDEFKTIRRVGIQGDIIAYLGNEEIPAATVIDGTGHLLTPAFVDTHSHADFMVAHEDNDGGSSISQGIGTLVVGNCGMSSTPPSKPLPLLLNKQSDRNLDREDHLKYIENRLALNIGELLGHGSLRMSVLGEARRATSAETANMCSMLRDFLQAGWAGMSVGLNYPEAAGYERRELLELSKTLAKFDRPLTCHIRDQGAGILDAMDEVIDVAAEAGCRVLISHLRLVSQGVDHLLPEVERRFDEHSHARFDMYPYVAGCTTLNLFFECLFQACPSASAPFAPQDVDAAISDFCAHSYRDIHVVQHRDAKYVNNNINDIANGFGEEPGRLVQHIYFADPNCICIFDNTSTDRCISRLIRHDRCLIGSDAWLYPANYTGSCHPRNFGAFTGFLTRYVRDGPIELSSGLRRITTGAADYFGLNAGRIAPGRRADITLFALSQLQERADFENPWRLSSGMERVWIAGQPVFENGTMNDARRPGIRLPAV